MSGQSSRALNLLFVSAVLCLLSTLPLLSPANVFAQTSSRLQTPTNVLFTRLAALRPLTRADEVLRAVFEAGGLEARLLYLRYGPDVLATSSHVIADPKAANAGTAYLLYAAPAVLAPHLLHLGILGLVTSSILAGSEAAKWRTAAVIAAMVLGVGDLASLATFDHTANARAVRATDVDAFYWKRRLVCRVLMSAVDGFLGWMIYLTATKRAFVEPAPLAERLETSARQLEVVLGKLRSLGAVRNVVFRDTMLRSKLERYWVQEQEVMRAVFEDRDVVGALNGILDNTDMARIEGDADGFVDSVLGNGGTTMRGTENGA